MDSKPAQTQDSNPEVKQPEVKKATKRNRRFSKEILKDTVEVTQLRVKHTKYKGEQLSDTVRTDRKFNPRQNYYAGRPL